MSDILNKPAVSSVKEEAAIVVFGAFLKSEGLELAHAVHAKAETAARPPSGTGAVDPLRR